MDISFGQLLANKYLVPPFAVRFGGEFGLAMGISWLGDIWPKYEPLGWYVVEVRQPRSQGKGSYETVVMWSF